MKKIIKRLNKKAKKLGVILEFNPENFEKGKLDCSWYGGHIATIVLGANIEISICIQGDIVVTLLDKDSKVIAESRDKCNSGAFLSNMSPYIKNDKHLSRLIQDGRLVYTNNNWIEFNGYIDLNFIDLSCVDDNILDNNILVAIEQVLDSLGEISKKMWEVYEG